MLADVLPFLAIPAVAAVLGGVIAAFRPPGKRLQSVIQHFAAGVVFAAVAGELLPELMYEAAALPTIVGFVLGVGLMLGVKKLTEGGPAEGAPESAPTNTRGLVATVAVDIAIDGLLVGVGFAAGAEAGLVVTIALSLEVLFLVLATAAALVGAGASRGRVLATTAGLTVLLLAGAVGGTLAAGALTGGVLAGVLAFGVAALLYLVTEELLVEAHDTPDTPLAAATFFLGFLALLLLEMAL
ncbi:ZIP family metal transporter [Rubrivirga sp. S365]|uniref:ZIP family metal transporter n=1 Tax=Rubrivirga sp. S365 TaxID=3076080 RepID=UPI00391F8162